jgi:hypothetical protein
MNSSITREARGQKRNMLHETRESDAAFLVSISRRAKNGNRAFSITLTNMKMSGCPHATVSVDVI